MYPLNKSDAQFYTNCGFDVFNIRDHYFELQAQSGEYWCIYKEEKDIVLLLHKHDYTEKYHLHYVFTDTTAPVSEILQHENYIIKRNKQKERIFNGKKVKIVL